MLNVFCNLRFKTLTLDRLDAPQWPQLLRPLADASMALGALSQSLETTRLHQAWLWREMSRTACRIAQIAGHRVKTESLIRRLAGLPLDAEANDSGLAAARRIFLMGAPLFWASKQADSESSLPELLMPLWGFDEGQGLASEVRGAEGERLAPERDKKGAGEGAQLRALVRELASFAGDGTKPVLIDLMIDLRQHAEARRLPSGLLRLALPLALHQSGLLPKAAPALLGGRLSLGTTRSELEQEPMTLWLSRVLSSLAKEAKEAASRLADLQTQHQAWHQRLLREGLRGHSRMPLVLDLLAATPVVSAGLVAKHLDCTPQAAGRMLRQLAELGIVSEATTTSRWKVYLAGDLALADGESAGADEPLVLSEPLPSVDHQAIEATLTDLFVDLDRLERRVTSNSTPS